MDVGVVFSANIPRANTTLVFVQLTSPSTFCLHHDSDVAQREARASLGWMVHGMAVVRQLAFPFRPLRIGPLLARTAREALNGVNDQNLVFSRSRCV